MEISWWCYIPHLQGEPEILSFLVSALKFKLMSVCVITYSQNTILYFLL